MAKDVAPKRAKLKAAQDNLAKKQSALKAAQEALASVLAKVQALKDKYDDSTSKKRALEEELADLEGKLERAEKLVTGLAGERTRWWVGWACVRLGFRLRCCGCTGAGADLCTCHGLPGLLIWRVHSQFKGHSS